MEYEWEYSSFAMLASSCSNTRQGGSCLLNRKVFTTAHVFGYYGKCNKLCCLVSFDKKARPRPARDQNSDFELY